MPWSNCSQIEAMRASGHAFGIRGAAAQRSGEHAAGRRPHHELADPRPDPEPGEQVPANILDREHRHTVDEDDPLDALGVALREREPHGRSPVVDDQLDAVDPEVIEQPLEEVRKAFDGVVQVAALSRPSEADQVGGDPAAALEE